MWITIGNSTLSVGKNILSFLTSGTSVIKHGWLGNPRTIHEGYSVAMARAAGAARGGSEIHCVMRAAIDYKNMV